PHASSWLKAPGPVSDGMKIGLLGGSFNPAHEGHLYISLTAMKKLGLDYVWWLVAPQNPLKPVAGMAPLERRHNVALATANHPRILVVNAEHTLSTRYTIDTLTALKKRFPQVNFVWLMGSDNLEGFHRWRRWQDIAKLVPIAIVQRPGHTLALAHAKPVLRFPTCFHDACQQFATRKAPAFAILDGRRNPLSATAIRMAADRDAAVSGALAPW
ncbi:MAG TPA: nicotinate-nucleotide adenylyltransferase, partial [Rhizomicrobium sp.]|nr:nicotinate-nucleotide adenylyltransferase [Rhizomicrobium sp.]